MPAYAVGACVPAFGVKCAPHTTKPAIPQSLCVCVCVCVSCARDHELGIFMLAGLGALSTAWSTTPAPSTATGTGGGMLSESTLACVCLPHPACVYVVCSCRFFRCISLALPSRLFLTHPLPISVYARSFLQLTYAYTHIYAGVTTSL